MIPYDCSNQSFHTGLIAELERICRSTSMFFLEEREEEAKKMRNKIVDRITEIEAEEMAKSEIQNDIGGEFALFECCKQFKTPEKKFLHMKNHHDKDATKCELCRKELSSKSSLDRHLLIHAKWQPYKCCHCDKQFSTNGNMHRHKKTHKNLSKNSKLVKEDNEVNEDSFAEERSKRNMKGNTSAKASESSPYDEEEEFEEPVTISKPKRKKKDQTNLFSSNNKKLKSEKKDFVRNENSAEKCLKLSEIKTENTNDNLEGKTDSSTDIQDLKKSDISETAENAVQTKPLINYNSPSKDEFITTLGLRITCKSKERGEINSFGNEIIKKELGFEQIWFGRKLSELFSMPLKNHEIEKMELADEISKNVDIETAVDNLITDCDKGSNDFADIKSIVLNVTTKPQVGEPDKTSEVNEKDESKRSINESLNNGQSQWLPESPETSTEESNFDPINETDKDNSGDYLEIHQYCCEHCKKKFKNKKIWQKHLIKHSKLKPFKCTLCDAKFLSKPNAVRHVIKIHKKRRGTAKNMIAFNMEENPSVGTKTVCEWCGEDQKNPLILENHKRASKGCRSKPFICLLCDKSFSTRNNGKRHQAKHHPGESNVDCIVANSLSRKIRDQENPFLSSTKNSGNESTLETNLHNDVKSDNITSDMIDESTLSRPKKVLDAAQSLLDMSSSASPIYSDGINLKKSLEVCEQEISDKSSEVNSESSDVVERNMQEHPLDLSVHPMDLSTKIDEDTETQNFLQNYISPLMYFSTVALNNENLSSPFKKISKKSFVAEETPLNLVKKNFLNEAGSFPLLLTRGIPFSSSTPAEVKTIPYCDISFRQTVETKESNASTSLSENCAKTSSVQCNICLISFANNSNKRRHERKKHQHIQEIVNNPSIPECGHSESKSVSNFNNFFKTKSILSKKTKEALLTKVNSVKPNEVILDFSPNKMSETSSFLGNSTTESENGDLASVSSLINTANSPQLKKYLTSDSNSDSTPTFPAESIISNAASPADKVSNLKLDKRGPEKHRCSSCQKDFTCKSSFNRHSVIHTKERPYVCFVCSQTFTVKSNRDRHLKKIHKYTPEDLTLSSGKRLQRKTTPSVPCVSAEIESVKKDSPSPVELSQCNKENQRLFTQS